MFRILTSSRRGRRIPGIDSDDEEDSIETSMTGEGFQRSPPIITWEHGWPVSETRAAWADSPFARLPTEIIIQIFGFLSVDDLGNIALVCRCFKLITDQDDIWRSRCNPLYDDTPTKSFKQIYMDWVYGKYLRRQTLHKINHTFGKTREHIPCILGVCCSSSEYFLRTKSPAYSLPVSGFVQHPNFSSDVTITLSVDIDRTVIALIALLEKATGFTTNWERRTIVHHMIMRYYRFLQLKALYPKERLIPTLDIEIVWQTHLLRPAMYRGDCLRLFHRIIDHTLLADDLGQSLKEQALVNTCRLYKERFGEEYCPLPVNDDDESEAQSNYRYSLLNYIQCPIPAYSYWDDTSIKFLPELPSDYKNPFSFVEADIILDSYWFELYCNDMYGVGLRIMAHDSQEQRLALSSAMNRLKKSYERFLYMASKQSNMNDKGNFLQSTHAIDIVWHSHMQEPLKYADDCNRLLGFMIDHLPWSSMKTSEQIEDYQKKMNELWKSEFHRDMDTDHLE